MVATPQKAGASSDGAARFQALRAAISAFAASPLAAWASLAPWELTGQSETIVRRLLGSIDLSAFTLIDEVAVHVSATVESGAVLKGPLIVGAGSFVAAGAYLRGGNWIAERCVVGPGAELKSSFVFADTKLAHFNFVGDSILGTDVNLEAGSIICNFRNERADKEIQVRWGHTLKRTGVQKFGALVGDRCRIGANAVIAPGAWLPSGTVVHRATLRDDELWDHEADF
jgi:UDP-N-acetylglucosamine diphosphorylase / glucose-1-phosphate thymidylyltransferase / UDP-N-acetylgalactosamine diphosphorylase / glucosamine-1-phosphate N-acetyltransferase / galactosamine-1-phosphate N-acetyltransferase